MRIVFVCTGNTCRSPMAEGLFRRMIREHGEEDKVTCESVGLAAAEGAPASKNAVAVCREVGVDISGHRARGLQNLPDASDVDLFAVMTPAHAGVLQQMGVPSGCIYQMEGGIPDPYGGDEAVYRACRDRLTGALDSLYKLVQQRMERKSP